ncbi:hypothetical protein [Acidianus ambivalens]|nr:hypothetical protein [Acidianus ambivalens]
MIIRTIRMRKDEIDEIITSPKKPKIRDVSIFCPSRSSWIDNIQQRVNC